MQEALLEAELKAGAEVRHGANVQQVCPGAPPSVVASSNGHSEVVHARLIVEADGRSSLTSRSAGFQTRRDSDRILVAGVLLAHGTAAEDTGRIVIDSKAGCVAVLFPQGKSRAGAYFCYDRESRKGTQGDSDFPDFIESRKRAGAQSVRRGGSRRTTHQFRGG